MSCMSLHEAMLDEVYGLPMDIANEQKVDSQRSPYRPSSKRAGLVAWIKMSSGCSMCSYREHPAALDFHHVNPADKTKNVAEMVRNGSSISEILEEVEKCIVLCSNCHRIFHASNIEKEGH